MIRRLFVLLLVSISWLGVPLPFDGAVCKFGPVQARPRSLADTSAGENEYHKPGMTRWDVLHVFRAEEGAPRLFRTEGGLPAGLQRETFVSSGLPLFQNDVDSSRKLSPIGTSSSKSRSPTWQFATMN